MNDDTIQALRNHALADQAKTLPRTEAAFAAWAPRSIREEFERMERDLASTEQRLAQATHFWKTAEKERDEFIRQLSAVIPADFKFWHQNADCEKPQVAAWAIKNLRYRLEDAEAELAAARKWIEADSVRIREIPILRASLARESAEVAELRRDKERLDWMLANGDPFEIWINTDRICVENRDAIDAAMKETTP